MFVSEVYAQEVLFLPIPALSENQCRAMATDGRGMISRPCCYSYHSDNNEQMQMAAGYEENVFQDVCVSGKYKRRDTTLTIVPARRQRH